MPSWNDPHWEAKDCAQRFARFNVPLPADAQRWRQRLLELQECRPEGPPPGTVAELIANGADQADIDKTVAQKVGQAFLRQEHGEAEKICGRRVMASVREHREHLHAELADIAQDLITRLNTAASIDEDFAELARQRRTDDSALLASAPADAATLQDLYTLRDGYLVLPGEDWSTGFWDARTWRNPWELTHAVGVGGGIGNWEGLRDGIRRGGTLWFPSVQEARAESEPHEPQPEPIDPRLEAANAVRWS